ncbi:MAG: GntR family transcriptional regulator [Succiniclasticum sp.]|jgi:DNA-binding GntR family transcriptional regulator|nr:GntR family transcriptional regulator [Succiniclasticum sp.]MCI6222743.1 GntR family transcriptional regulator [Selenomonadales bacterium]MDY2870496.1 GntR family transcriptional regulator [Succiniclasticum sp.]MDY6302838.1 GntR family transcriptional regulator [Succiniclasticum sp.]MDY6346140.1 GntR family transcriptional regulator [Succiniclasticum sp.]
MERAVNLKDKAYAIIRDKIIRCVYKPGEFLVEAELIETIGASRTPIREALNKLEQEGLVDILPKRGIVVRDVTLADINAIYEIRFLVEPAVLKRYACRLPRSLLQDLKERNRKAGQERQRITEYNLDEDIHRTLMMASGNPFLVDLMDKIYAQNHRIRILSGEALTYRMQETLAEHDRILDCLLQQDYEGAARALEVHLHHSQEGAVRLMATSRSSWGYDRTGVWSLGQLAGNP